jgi:integrase
MWTDVQDSSIVTYRGKTGVRSLLPVTTRLKKILETREAASLSLYVFPHNTKTGHHRTPASKGLIRAADRAGLNAPEIVSKFGKFTAHSCRDTYATRLIRAGLSLYQVQTMLGHASPAMTQKYAHLTTEDIGQLVLGALE